VAADRDGLFAICRPRRNRDADGSQRLVGFTRVHLGPGDRTKAQISLAPDAGGKLVVR